MDHRSQRELCTGPLHGATNTNTGTSLPTTTTTPTPVLEEYEIDLEWPFEYLDGLDCDAIREAAYEIFFTACRSSPGFGGRNTSMSSSHDHHGNVVDGGGNESHGSGSINGRVNGVVMTPTSKVKKALGLKMLKKSPSRRMSFIPTGYNGGGGMSGTSSFVSQGHCSINTGSGIGMGFSSAQNPWPRRPLTSAELMRQQMRVTEQSDHRLRKTLTRTLAGQTGKRSETIILPLELLRHLKPSEFNDPHEYHAWQKRQLKILETGLILYPSIPIDKANSFMIRLRDIIRAGELKAIDTSKNSDMMRTLCNSIVSLCWRSSNGAPTTVCHWADGYPLNVHIYTALLRSIFSTRDETLVLDEVDELLELMKKTWSTLGFNKPMHNVCFAWVLFEQYVVTNQVEPDLLRAAFTMLSEVENDVKKSNRDETYMKILSSMLVVMQNWAEKKLLNYHEYFNRGTIGGIDNLLPLGILSTKILAECRRIETEEGKKGDVKVSDSSGNRIDHYIRSSMKNAFARINDNVKNATMGGRGEAYENLLQLAKETEDLAAQERELFSPILKKWHTTAGSIAAVTLHQCYGEVLKQHLAGTKMLNSEIVGVLQRAAKLEKVLVQMVVEDFDECGNGGKVIIREMMPYEVDTVTIRLLGQWIDERLKKGKKLLLSAKKTETWNPKSKTELYAHSAVELMALIKETVNDFFEIPIGVTEDLILDLAEGLEKIIEEYIIFVASCGSKQNYLPALPPLTRCNQDSMFSRFWKRASPCGVRVEDMHQLMTTKYQHPSPSTSIGTQCLYVRLNTLHYLITHIHSLDKTLAVSPRVLSKSRLSNRKQNVTSFSYFEQANQSIQSACEHVSEVAAYRLIFLDSSLVFYESLYAGSVTSSRLRPTLRILKENLTVLTTILTDQAQALAMKEVMKASFEAFLMVLLAGVPSRIFNRSDYEMIEEDFDSLKRVFCAIPEDVIQKEAEKAEGVISLMGQSTEQLIEDFSIVTCETSGIGFIGIGQKLPMPPTTGRWNRSDPNTILRVLCHRNDRTANLFLKKSFQLAKRNL
ncbi:hypothetical protein ES319_D09G249000v1 [Gossypium barbadense]|uniref:MHD1 domain-containing protein n=1 Tax=Gossypium barbadense TaxID=3634 RepID=A0A5J5Q725_GOSBA|nr:hypothetical protein ES319_D09G249000v1 [Gossypium barbadense]